MSVVVRLLLRLRIWIISLVRIWRSVRRLPFRRMRVGRVIRVFVVVSLPCLRGLRSVLVSVLGGLLVV